MALAKALFFFLTKIPTEANTKKNVVPWDKTAFSWQLSLWNCSYSELKLKYVRLNLKKSKNCCLHNAIPITWSNYEAFHATLQTRQMVVFTAASSPRIKYSAQNSNFQKPQILKWLICNPSGFHKIGTRNFCFFFFQDLFAALEPWIL